jgi:uncharacterized protein
VKKIRLDIIGLSSSHSQIGHYALVLGETSGNRRLPIIIGGAEAQAIALELENIKTNRPMTHDLIYNLARHFDINLVEVIINDLSEGVFYARLVLEADGEIHEIDSRPSDAVAIGVRFKVPIYSYEKVLSEAGIVIDDEEGGSEESEESGGGFSLAEIERSDPIEEDDPAPTSSTRRGGGRSADDMVEELKKKLEDALNKEDYEMAARLRDEISRLED